MKIARNILAVLIGIAFGMIVNGGLVSISDSIIANPDGYDNSNMENMKATFHLLTPKHMIMPFIAHALGAFTGAFIAGLIAATHKKRFALSIGFFFLLGGITMVIMVSSPIWFIALDLIVAYIPMAWLAGKIVAKKKK